MSIKRKKVHNLVIEPTPQADSESKDPMPIKWDTSHGCPLSTASHTPAKILAFSHTLYLMASLSTMLLKFALSVPERLELLCTHTLGGDKEHG